MTRDQLNFFSRSHERVLFYHFWLQLRVLAHTRTYIYFIRVSEPNVCCKHDQTSYKSMKDRAKLQALASELLAAHGPIARKTCKQTIMTSVYGVTFMGARMQILKQLKAKE